MASVISGDANVSAAEFGYLDGVTSALQTQLDAKLNLAGGKILQTVLGTTTAALSTTSTSYVTTGLTASITPSSASNKILVIAQIAGGYVTAASPGFDAYYTIFRGTVAGTNVSGSLGLHQARVQVAGATFWTSTTMSCLDSPATTSSQAYTVGMRSSNVAATTHVSNGGELCSIILLEVSA